MIIKARISVRFFPLSFISIFEQCYRPSVQSIDNLGKEGYGKSTLSKARTRGARSENQDYYGQGGNTRGNSAA